MTEPRPTLKTTASLPAKKLRRKSMWGFRVLVIAGICALIFLGGRMKKQSDRAQSQVAKLNRQIENLESQIRILNGLKLRGELKFSVGGSVAGVTSGLVKIVSAPKIPVPKAAEYPACLAVFEAEVMILNEGGGSADSEVLEVNVVIPAFVNREPRVGLALKPGDWVMGQILKEEDIDSEFLAHFAIADDSDRFDLPRIFLVDGKSVEGGVTEIAVPDGDEFHHREKQIQIDSDELQKVIEHWDGNYKKWEEAALPTRLALNKRVYEAGGELLADGTRFSFFRAFEWPKAPFPDDVISCVSSLHRQLDARGIELIVVPVPPKNFPNVNRFVEQSAMPRGGIFPYRYLLFDQLMKNGVEVVDVLPALTAGLEDFPRVYYDGLDNHPADGGVQIMASEIAKRLRRFDFKKQFDSVFKVPVRYSIPAENTRFNKAAFVGEPYSAHRILPASKENSDAFTEKRVLLVGDSFAGVPLRYGVPDANLTSHLGKELGYWPESIRISGSAPQILRVLAANPDALEDTDVVVFCFFELYLYFDRAKGERYQWDIVELPEGNGQR